jgi:RimJ/RimL family protein N-acetyltransferase
MGTRADGLTADVVATFEPAIGEPVAGTPDARLLRDGSIVTFRPIEAGDVEALRRLFFRLSPETVYLRFFQPIHEPRTATLEHLASVDHDRRDAIVAVANGEIIGVARYDRAPDDSASAEVAIVVEDAWQGRGLGLLLLRELTSIAVRRGIRIFTATVLGENRRMLLLARSLNHSASWTFDQGQWEVAIPLTRASGLAAT